MTLGYARYKKNELKEKTEARVERKNGFSLEIKICVIIKVSFSKYFESNHLAS